jgi:hypothetical protein
MTIQNCIYFLFEKIFRQITLDGSELRKQPKSLIWEKTFESERIKNLIASAIGINSVQIDNLFVESLLLKMMRNKLDVDLLLNPDIDPFGYNVTYQNIKLAVINNNLSFIKKVNSKLFDVELLAISADFGYTEMYFWFRNFEIIPNVIVYNKAVQGGSLDIVKDVNNFIGLSADTIKTAFESNHTKIIQFIVETIIEEKIKLDPNNIAYSFLNANLELINWFIDKKLVNWHPELYYSALLSGSMDIIKLVESYIPNIHDNYILDTTRTPKGKGRSSLILKETIYNQKYFSHTMNYAIQSNKLEIVQYVYNLGYGITVSNIVTAIKQASPEILQFLLDRFTQKLPYHLWHYFTLNSFVKDKINKLNILINSHFSDIIHNHTKDGLQIENVHIDMIRNTNTMQFSDDLDPDYLLGHNQLFSEHNEIQIWVIKLRISLLANTDFPLKNIPTEAYEDLCGTLFMWGNLNQIKHYQPLLKCIPNMAIIAELICRNQIAKLCYLVHRKLLTDCQTESLYRFAIIIDSDIVKIFKDYPKPKISISQILLSWDNQYILKFINENPNLRPTKMDCKNIILIGDKLLVEKLKAIMNPQWKDELIEYCIDCNLQELINYL